jgi:hypothetical protein
MPLLLPSKLRDIAAQLPESSYGACRATLVLRSGRQVTDVTLAWGGEIVKIGDRRVANESEMGFSIGDVVDVLAG